MFDFDDLDDAEICRSEAAAKGDSVSTSAEDEVDENSEAAAQKVTEEKVVADAAADENAVQEVARNAAEEKVSAEADAAKSRVESLASQEAKEKMAAEVTSKKAAEEGAAAESTSRKEADEKPVAERDAHEAEKSGEAVPQNAETSENATMPGNAAIPENESKQNMEERMQEEIGVDVGSLKSLARLILWPRRAPKPASLLERPCTRVCVFGAHHTCTGAMMREIPRFFDVKITNKHRADNPRLWKHRIFRNRPPIPDTTFCVCLVKDPAFWIQSLARNPLEGTFYEIFPVGAVYNQWRQMEVVPVQATSRRQLFSHVLFDDTLYDDAVGIWEATVRSYFEESIFPVSRTVVVRCEDFLFRFDEVIDALARRGLPLRANAPAERTPLDDTAKDASHPDCTDRKSVV